MNISFGNYKGMKEKREYTCLTSLATQAWMIFFQIKKSEHDCQKYFFWLTYPVQFKLLLNTGSSKVGKLFRVITRIFKEHLENNFFRLNLYFVHIFLKCKKIDLQKIINWAFICAVQKKCFCCIKYNDAKKLNMCRISSKSHLSKHMI